MMVLKVVTATLGDNVEVMMTTRPYLARFYKGAVERIVGIVHLIHSEDSLEACLVESLVMGYKRQSFYLRLNLFPDIGEDWSFLSIFTAESIDTGTYIIIIVRFGMDKRVELVYFLAIPTITTPTEQTLVRSKLAVSKSIAAKSFISSLSFVCCKDTSILLQKRVTVKNIFQKKEIILL